MAGSPEDALDLHLRERAAGPPALRFTRAGAEPAVVTFHGRTDDGVVHAVVTAEQVGGPTPVAGELRPRVRGLTDLI